jgi:hypothetical protein
MTVISFSIDEEIKDDLERIAKEERRSKSDVFREMYDAYKFKKTLAKVQKSRPREIPGARHRKYRPGRSVLGLVQCLHLSSFLIPTHT